MTDARGYQEYVGDDAHMTKYRAYQRKYASKVRESDRVAIELLRGALRSKVAQRVLDIGCSTGNFLRHVRSALPGGVFEGIDLDPHVIQANRVSADLDGIGFRVLDALELRDAENFDAVTANAVLLLLSDAEYETVLTNVFRSLRPGGVFVVFDFVHEFESRLDIVEHSASHASGLRIAQRPRSAVEAVMRNVGFDQPRFLPFEMPFDLERSTDPTDLTSHTVTSADGGRLSFRGALHQPWCHVVARKP